MCSKVLGEKKYYSKVKNINQLEHNISYFSVSRKSSDKISFKFKQCRIKIEFNKSEETT